LDDVVMFPDHWDSINELERSMDTKHQQKLHQSTGANSIKTMVPWTLLAGRALTLRPTTSGVLRVSHGRAWATLDVDRRSLTSDAGDHFLNPENALVLRAGQRVVIESWPVAGASGIGLVWEPEVHQRKASLWDVAVLLPVRAMRHGLIRVARAMPLWQPIKPIAHPID
jgi:hypothetical protein